MKRLYIIFVVLFSTNVFAVYNDDIPNACGTTPNNKFIAIFQINTYTCASGYFLPANTDGCRPCPSDHTCNGGTFEFNPTKSQGIIYNQLTQDSDDSCAVNISHKMVAKFQPNTVTLNYDNNNGTTQTGTCTYDGTITLPDNPSKPGYTFVGWILNNN